MFSNGQVRGADTSAEHVVGGATRAGAVRICVYGGGILITTPPSPHKSSKQQQATVLFFAISTLVGIHNPVQARSHTRARVRSPC